jgi:hypothetical protein
MPSDRMPHLAPRPIRRFRLRSLSYGGHVAPRNDSRAVIPRACGGSSTPRLLGSIINRQPRHCEPPGRANARPMTGSSPRKGRMDCFAALAMTGERHTSAFPRHLSPGPCKSFRPEKRAQGTQGACCTRGLACKNAHRKRTRAYRYSRSIPASLRNGFTAYAVLSPATNSSCHRHRRIKVLRARLGSQHLRRFDTSNGCQDHTVLPYASAPFVWRAMVAHGTPALRSRSRPTPLRPPHLIPTFVTTADAPRAG